MTSNKPSSPCIVSVHSFRGGTGKSNTTANVATTLALGGARVGIIDTDIQSPGIHVLFHLDPSEVEIALNDYLFGRCEIANAAYEVGSRVLPELTDKIFLIPSSVDTAEITRVLRDGYDVARLHSGLQALVRSLRLDYLVVDTHPGLNEETLLSIAVSDALLILMRPDQQDYQGTAVTVDVAQKLEVPRLGLVVNKVPEAYGEAAVAQRVRETYGCDLAGLIPHSDDLMVLGSEGVFVARHPQHELTRRYRAITDYLRAP